MLYRLSYSRPLLTDQVYRPQRDGEEPAGVTAKFRRDFGIFGPPNHCMQQLSELLKLAADISPPPPSRIPPQFIPPPPFDPSPLLGGRLGGG